MNNVGVNEWSHLVEQLIYSATLNRGYRVEVQLKNTNFELLSNLNKSGYFLRGRLMPLVVKFRISWASDFDEKETTTERTAIVSQIEDGHELGTHTSHQTLIAIDPPSYYLSIGDAFGGVWSGKIEKVITDVVKRYAPFIDLSVSETDSSETAKYWQMRMTPKKFIATLLDWSTRLTKKQTRWIVAPEDYSLQIKEQADFEMKDVKAIYEKMLRGENLDTIRQWAISHNLFHAQINTNHLTFTASSTYGEYIIKNTSDKTTKNKYATERYAEFAYRKPSDEVKARENPGKNDIKGMAQVIAEPEIYNAGEAGDYNKYATGGATAKYLSLLDSIMSSTIEVPGHHIWDSSVGLGASAVQLMYAMDNQDPHYMTGVHMVHGFKHTFKPGAWHTLLKLMRLDADAEAKNNIPIKGETINVPEGTDFGGVV